MRWKAKDNWWHLWYAWYPVNIDGEYVWLEWVERYTEKVTWDYTRCKYRLPSRSTGSLTKEEV